MATPVRSSDLKVETGFSAAMTGVTINGVAASNALVAVCVATRNDATAVDLVTGFTTTVGGSPGNTWAIATGAGSIAARIAYSSGAQRTEITVWLCQSASAGNTVGKPTIGPTSGVQVQCYYHMDEWNGFSASATDQVKTASAASGTATLSTGSTGTLAQASEVAYLVYGNRWDWANPATLPSPWTLLQSVTGNTTLAARTGHQTTTTTAALSASITNTDDFDGSVALIVTFKLGSTTLRLEVDNIDTTDITGTTGWTFGAWDGDVFNTSNAPKKVWTSYAATLASGKLVFPDAPPGAAVDQQYNVIGYQPAGTLCTPIMLGTVRST